MALVDGRRGLLVWQRGVALVERVYFLTRRFPREEQFGLTSQARRSSVSVPVNIAEGYGRGTRAAYIGFLRVARGSLLELETHLIVARRIGLVSDVEVEPLLTEIEEIGRMLHVLIVKVRDTQRTP